MLLFAVAAQSFSDTFFEQATANVVNCPIICRWNFDDIYHTVSDVG